jgi:intracellular septation protein
VTQENEISTTKHHGIKQSVEIGGLIAFALTYFLSMDFMLATVVLIGGCILAISVGYYLDRKIAPMPLFTALLAILFGGLTLIFNNPIFLKIKLTIIYGIFALL